MRLFSNLGGVSEPGSLPRKLSKRETEAPRAVSRRKCDLQEGLTDSLDESGGTFVD